jgi:hypothetical protein
VETIVEFLGRLDPYLRGLRPGSLEFWRACAVPALAVTLFIGSSRLPRLWRLMQRGNLVEGVIEGTPCAGGPRITYRFVANGQTFEGVGRVRWLELDCSALVAGMHVPVHYLPDEPTLNAPAKDLPRVIKREILALVVLGVAILLGIAGVLVAFPRVGQGATSRTGA